MEPSNTESTDNEDVRSHNTFTFIETEVADNAQAALAKAQSALNEAIYATERAELALNESKWAVIIAIIAVSISIVGLFL